MTALANEVRRLSGASGLLGIDAMTEALKSVLMGNDEWMKYIDGRATKINFDVAEIPYYAFYSFRYLTEINLPNCRTIGQYAFYEAGDPDVPITLNIPKALTIGSYAFANTALQDYIEVPTVRNIQERLFSGVYNTKGITFASATSVAANAFDRTRDLVWLDFAKKVNFKADSLVNLRESFKALIMRNSTMSTLASASSFSFLFPDEVGNVYFLVPRSLVDTYKANTVWANFASYFHALEDYTVDGTTTGEINWELIV